MLFGSIGARAASAVLRSTAINRGAYRTFVTPTGGRLLFVSAPSGNEELFEELGRLGPHPTADQLAEVNERFGTTSLPGDNGRARRQLHTDPSAE